MALAKLLSEESRKIARILIWSLFFAVLVSPVIWENIHNVSNQHFIYLADAFLNARTYIDPMFIKDIPLDYTFYKGHYFWPEAPFVAILLIPFVFLFGTSFLQAYIHGIVAIIVFGLLYTLSRHFRFGKEDSLYLASGFVFGSVYYGVIMLPWSYYLAQSLALLFLLLAILNYYKKRNWLFISTFLALAILTRYTYIFAPLFFFILFIIEHRKTSIIELSKKIVFFSLPLIVVVLGVFSYNYIRFDKIITTGYEGHSIGAIDPFNFSEYALFNIENIPGNIYYYFLKAPEPIFEEGTFHLTYPYLAGSPISLSFIIVAPLFLYVFFRPKNKEKIVVTTLWVVMTIQLLFFLSYFSPGTTQIHGPRFMLDLLPWLFLLLLYRFRESPLTRAVKILIVISALVNLYFITTVLHPNSLGIPSDRLPDSLYSQLF